MNKEIFPNKDFLNPILKNRELIDKNLQQKPSPLKKLQNDIDSAQKNLKEIDYKELPNDIKKLILMGIRVLLPDSLINYPQGKSRDDIPGRCDDVDLGKEIIIKNYKFYQDKNKIIIYLSIPDDKKNEWQEKIDINIGNGALTKIEYEDTNDTKKIIEYYNFQVNEDSKTQEELHVDKNNKDNYKTVKHYRNRQHTLDQTADIIEYKNQKMISEGEQYKNVKSQGGLTEIKIHLDKDGKEKQVDQYYGNEQGKNKPTKDTFNIKKNKDKKILMQRFYGNNSDKKNDDYVEINDSKLPKSITDKFEKQIKKFEISLWLQNKNDKTKYIGFSRNDHNYIKFMPEFKKNYFSRLEFELYKLSKNIKKVALHNPIIDEVEKYHNNHDSGIVTYREQFKNGKKTE
jgi:hypothetical protein